VWTARGKRLGLPWALPAHVLKDNAGDSSCDHYHQHRVDISLTESLGMRREGSGPAWTWGLPESAGDQGEFEFGACHTRELLTAGVQRKSGSFDGTFQGRVGDMTGGWPRCETAGFFAVYARIVHDLRPRSAETGLEAKVKTLPLNRVGEALEAGVRRILSRRSRVSGTRRAASFGSAPAMTVETWWPTSVRSFRIGEVLHAVARDPLGEPAGWLL
jgi:hypothetical protein